MGNNHSTPTMRPKDLERWARQGHTIRTDEVRGGRGPDGLMYTQIRRNYTRGNPNPFFGPSLNEGPRGPAWGPNGAGPNLLPGPPGLYPDPAGGPDIIRPGDGGLRYSDAASPFGRPAPYDRMPVFERRPQGLEELGPGFYAGSGFGQHGGMPFGGSPPPGFGFPGDMFPPRGASYPFAGVSNAGGAFPPPYRSFGVGFGPVGGGYGPFASPGFGGGPPFSHDFPDNASVESWGPVRGSRSSSPGFVFAEDGVPLEGSRRPGDPGMTGQISPDRLIGWH